MIRKRNSAQLFRQGNASRSHPGGLPRVKSPNEAKESAKETSLPVKWSNDLGGVHSSMSVSFNWYG